MTVQECQQKMTSSEFIMWCEYLRGDYENNIFHRLDYYLAQVACEVRRSFVKNPKSIKMQDFVIEFAKKKPKKKIKKSFDIEKSKAFWFGGLGLKGKK